MDQAWRVLPCLLLVVLLVVAAALVFAVGGSPSAAAAAVAAAVAAGGVVQTHVAVHLRNSSQMNVQQVLEPAAVGWRMGQGSSSSVIDEL